MLCLKLLQFLKSKPYKYLYGWKDLFKTNPTISYFQKSAQYSQRYGQKPKLQPLCLKISVRMRGIISSARMRGIKSSVRMRMVTSRDPFRPIKSLKNVVEYQFVGVLILLSNLIMWSFQNLTWFRNSLAIFKTDHSDLSRYA